MECITEKGKQALKKIKEEEKKNIDNTQRAKTHAQEIFPYIVNHICPHCGKKSSPLNINTWINGGFGPICYFIDCPYCGFYETNISDKRKAKFAQYYFKMIYGEIIQTCEYCKHYVLYTRNSGSKSDMFDCEYKTLGLFRKLKTKNQTCKKWEVKMEDSENEKI